jgi:beta-galactosidase GanA
MLIDYDKYSLKIDNKRTLIRSAAIHYFRMPGQEMWRDRLSKLKAAGYNTVDIYFCWGYHSSEPGKYDFTDIRDVRALLDITAELGLYVIARPGPYINAELSLGGLPTWLLNVPNIHLRNRKHGAYIYLCITCASGIRGLSPL